MIPRIRVIANEEIPLIHDVDVLVINGGLAGMEVARFASENGRNVLLIESQTFLGGELTKTQRPWLDLKSCQDDLIRMWFPEEAGNQSINHENLKIYVLDELKKHYEDILDQYGVKLIYASRPVQYFREGEKWIVIIANKSGLQAISARVLVDNSETGILFWLNGDGTEKSIAMSEGIHEYPWKGTASISFSNITGICPQQLKVPQSLEIYDNNLKIYQGGFSDDQVFVEFSIQGISTEIDPLKQDREIYFKAYEKAFQLSEYLVNHLIPFSKAEIGVVSRRLLTRTGYNPADELYKGSQVAKEILTQEVSSPPIILNSPAHPRKFTRESTVVNENHKFTFETENEISQRYFYPKYQAKDQYTLWVLADVDVCVAGGGTSGAVAGYISAREKSRTTVVDMNPVLGGTGTIGGVNTHWMSSDTLVNDEIDERVKALGKKLNIPERYPRDKRVDENGREIDWFKDYSWNKEVKAFALYEMNRDAGAEVFIDCILMGTILLEKKVVGTVYATPFGRRVVLSQVTIDATGDGDVAAFAGADYVYGSGRDRYTMWTLMAQYSSPSRTLNNFTSPTDIGDLFEYTRFIKASRQRSVVQAYDHVEYVAPRQTRHIVCGYTITLKDQLLQRGYPDTVAVFYSNYDLKGRSSEDIVFFGLMPPNLDIEIPYRSLLPHGLENIIIAGKAFDLSHDASAAPRMQKDMQQLGAAVAVAAALAIKNQCNLRDVPVKDIRSRLSEIGNLPPMIREKRQMNDNPDLKSLVDNLQEDEPFEWLLMGYWERAEKISPIISIYYAPTAEVLPHLIRNYENSSGNRRLLFARLLLWHGNDSGVDDIISNIYKQLDDEYPLPTRKGDIYWTTGSPEQGIMPEMLYLVYPLARVRNEKIITLINDLVDSIIISKRDYVNRRQGIFDYIDSVAYVSERLADPVFIPSLEKLLDLPELRDDRQRRGIHIDYIQERFGYLNLALCRALARCGSKDGLLGLTELLAEPRVYLSKSAHDELRAITKLDFKINSPLWESEFQSWPERFDPIPYPIQIN